jgi:hypothetical protein
LGSAPLFQYRLVAYTNEEDTMYQDYESIVIPFGSWVFGVRAIRGSPCFSKAGACHL